MTESIIFKGALGINNKIDPIRHAYNPDTGVGFLQEAINCDIDDSGMISRRSGQIELSNVPSHSVFCDGGDCFVVQDRTTDAALYQVGTDFSLTGIRSGLIKGYRVSFCLVGDKTFYTNTVQNGVITNGISSAWPVGTYHGPDTFNDYSPVPVGSHIAYHQGRIWVSVDDVIYCSEPFNPGLFRLAKCFFQFKTNVKMIRPVAGGVWISDSEKIGFTSSAESWDAQKYIKKFSSPAHEWSDNQRLVDLSNTKWQISGLSAVWSSDKGICIGTSDGQLINVTEENLVYSTGANGATIVDEHNVINSVY